MLPGLLVALCRRDGKSMKEYWKPQAMMTGSRHEKSTWVNGASGKGGVGRAVGSGGGLGDAPAMDEGWAEVAPGWCDATEPHPARSPMSAAATNARITGKTTRLDGGLRSEVSLSTS